MEKKHLMPLRSLVDAQRWLEKSINEVEENATSISRGNSRVSCVKAMVSLYNLALSYAKLSMRGAKVKELDALVKLEFETETDAEAEPKKT